MNTYLLKDSNYYKIGKSNNVENRYNEIRKYNPGLLVVSFVEKDIETILHRKYKSKKIHNEWFLLNDIDEDEILKYFGNPSINEIPFKDYVIESGIYKGRHLITMKSNDEIRWLRTNLDNKAFDYWQKYYLRFCNIINTNEIIYDTLQYNNSKITHEEEKIILKDLLKKHELLTIQEYANKYNITYNGVKVRIRSGKVDYFISFGKTYILE